MHFDPTNPLAQRTLERLQNEQIIWLTTTSSNGTPQPRPVWFWWDGATVLILSQPQGYKVKHIVRSERASLHFNATADGDDIQVITGRAILDSNPVPTDQERAYLAKYGEGIAFIGMTPESYVARFHCVIRVIPEKVRGVDVL